MRSQGYAFQVELTYRALARGLRVQEVPITFRERSAGESKMSARIALEAMWLVPALRVARRRDGLRPGQASRATCRRDVRGRLNGTGGRADPLGMKAEQLAVVQGWAHTRAALGAGSAGRCPCCVRGRSAALPSPFCC